MKRSTTWLAVTATAVMAVSLPLAGMAADATSTGTPAVAGDATPGLSADEGATVKDVSTRHDGSKVTRYDRTYKGMRVHGGRYAVVQQPGQSFAGAQVVGKTEISLDSTTPTLTADQAAAKVSRAAVLGGAGFVQQTKTLMVYLDRHGESHLAYDVFTEGKGTKTADVKKHVFVDAHDGAILGTSSEVMTGQGDGIYNKNVTFGTVQTSSGWTLKDSHNTVVRDLARAQNGTGSNLYDSDNYWGGTGNKTQAQAVDVQNGLELTYNYFESKFGRRGVWDDGRGTPGRVRWLNCEANAMWNGQYASFGEGSGCARPVTQLDVVAHEMTHGVTFETSGFEYELESGGLNEAMSDIFGTMVEWYANLPSDVPDYNLGELINLRGDNKPLRYMDNPGKDGYSYTCWSPLFAQKMPDNIHDRVDVHLSSGPMNHAFYLLAEGSGAKTINGISYNSPLCNNAPAVSGIGREKAAKIVWTALTSTTTSRYSTYKQFRDEMIKAAKSLYGASSQECHSTAGAMTGVAVPVGSQACDSGPTTPPDDTTTDPAGTTPLTNGVAVPVSGAAGSETFYSIDVPAGATNLVIATSGGTGDLDLYTKFGTKPTDSSYLCRPYQSGNNETCTVAAPQAGTYYIRLKGYSTYSGATLKASYATDGPTTPPSTPPSTGGVLQNGVPVTVSGATGSDQYYSFSVPLTAKNLTVTTAGGTGDVDMYLKWNSKPTDTSYDCRPWQTGNYETCSKQYPYSGTYWVRLNAYQAYSGVTLKATWN